MHRMHWGICAARMPARTEWGNAMPNFGRQPQVEGLRGCIADSGSVTSCPGGMKAAYSCVQQIPAGGRS